MIGFEKRKIIAAYFFVGPWLAGFFVFTLYPLMYSFYVTFCTTMVGELHWAGFQNYFRVFNEPMFWKSIMNTFIYGLLSTPITLCFALLLSLLINQKLKGVHFFRAVYFLPVVAASDVVSTMTGTILFKRILVINPDLSQYGIHLSSEFISIISSIILLIMLSIWRTGIQMLVFLLGLINVPPEFYEAAEMDGATRWHMFWWVTIPSISPLILLNLLITVVESFTGLATTMRLINKSNTQIFIWDYVNELFYHQNEYGMALAGMWVFIIAIVALIGLLFYLVNRKIPY